MTTLALQNVCKTFTSERSSIVAARGLTFTTTNELLVLVGPSGCGKTTMLRMICGLEHPDSGTISLDGIILNNVPAKNRDVAMVFQSPALLPHLDVSQNIAFGLTLRRLPREEISRRVNDAAEKLNIVGKLGYRPDELSGGEAQRVALARAIVREPKVFLLDEPLSSLDAPSRRHLRREIVCLRQRLGVPMIYVTHDQREALALGDRVAVMHAGKLQQIGTPREIQSTPENSFVAEFFDTSL